MNLLTIGVNYRTASMELREMLAFTPARAAELIQRLSTSYGYEAAMLCTCNRVELYAARAEEESGPDVKILMDILLGTQGSFANSLQEAMYTYSRAEAIRHLFRVSGGLDSLVVGEEQIAGQVQSAYELAENTGTVGSNLHALFQHARKVSKRIRTETGLGDGKVSVSSLAIDYLAQVFDHFHDKTVLVIGAGKMGEITLKHLVELKPREILVTNRSVEKAQELANQCRGGMLPFEELDQAVAQADIILSTTGASEPIMTLDRFEALAVRRHGRPVAIIDIAVPRDFDPRIGDHQLVDLLINVDDLHSVRERVLKGRRDHIPDAEAIVDKELDKFTREWSRRRTAPAIARISKDWNTIRADVQAHCFSKLNGQLSDEDRATIEGAFRLMQNKFLHGPIAVLRDEAHQEGSKGLLDAVYKLFRL